MKTPPKCDMTNECKEPISHIDEKGFAYCAAHGYGRRVSGRKCRKLRPAELKKLMNGEQLTKY